MNALEAAYKNVTFDYLEDNDTYDNTQDFNDTYNRRFLRKSRLQFYDKK